MKVCPICKTEHNKSRDFCCGKCRQQNYRNEQKKEKSKRNALRQSKCSICKSISKCPDQADYLSPVCNNLRAGKNVTKKGPFKETVTPTVTPTKKKPGLNEWGSLKELHDQRFILFFTNDFNFKGTMKANKIYNRNYWKHLGLPRGSVTLTKSSRTLEIHIKAPAKIKDREESFRIAKRIKAAIEHEYEIDLVGPSPFKRKDGTPYEGHIWVKDPIAIKWAEQNMPNLTHILPDRTKALIDLTPTSGGIEFFTEDNADAFIKIRKAIFGPDLDKDKAGTYIDIAYLMEFMAQATYENTQSMKTFAVGMTEHMELIESLQEVAGALKGRTKGYRHLYKGRKRRRR